MAGADAQAAMVEYTVERREVIAEDYATEIWSDLDGESQITRDKVIEAISRLNKANTEKIYPRPEQVISILRELEIVVLEMVEEVSTQVEAACEDLSPLYRRAAIDVAFIVKEAAQDGANTYLEALKARQDEIKSKIKSLKPSGAMLRAEKIYEASIEAEPRLASIRGADAAKAFFIETFKD